jgi:hypothetical protein
MERSKVCVIDGSRVKADLHIAGFAWLPMNVKLHRDLAEKNQPRSTR